MTARVTVWGWARDNLLPIELAALRDRSSHLHGQAHLTISGDSPKGPWQVKLVTESGRSMPSLTYHGLPYDAACNGLAILEDQAKVGAL